MNILRDLMKGFSVYKNISKPKKKLNHDVKDLYLMSLLNLNKTVDDILFLKKFDEYNKEIYTQAKKCCLI